MAPMGGDDYVLRRVREAGVVGVRLWFTDLGGALREIAVPAEQLEAVLEEGVAVDGRVLGGPDLWAMPDAETFAVLPWTRDGSKAARMVCDLAWPDGAPFDGDPRAVLKRAVGRAIDDGYTPYAGADAAHYYYGASTAEGGGLCAPDGSPETAAVRAETLAALEELGVGVESSRHGEGEGQYEVTLQYQDALSLADALMTLRVAVREVARRHGRSATFMPCPWDHSPPSGLHLSLSLSEGGDTAFFDPRDPRGLSATARSFVAGLLDHAAEACVVTNPTVSSYKRLGRDPESPVAATWGGPTSGRADLVRVPAVPPGRDAAARVELRGPDLSGSPYLVLAVALEAGLAGVRRTASPPPERPADRAPLEAGDALPRHLDEARGLASGSPFLTRVLGAALLDAIVARADAEWRAFHASVGDWERGRYLGVG